MGTYGYAAPEYVATGNSSSNLLNSNNIDEKCNCYSYLLVEASISLYLISTSQLVLCVGFT